MEYINEHLPSETDLAVWGPELTANYYARGDLRISRVTEGDIRSDIADEYVLLCARSNMDQWFESEGSVDHAVKIMNIPPSVLFKADGND